MSGVWTPSQKGFSINLREMMAVQKGLLEFSSLLRGKMITLFCDNVTTVAYLRQLGVTRSQVLFLKPREILRWVEFMKITLLPQFIQGSLNTRADLLSRPSLVIGSVWTLHQEVVQDLLHQWPAIIDLFAASLTAKLPVFFAPAWEPKAAGVDTFLQPWDNLQAYAFSSHSHQKESSSQTESLSQLRSDSHRPLLASKRMVSRSAGTSIRHSNRTTLTSRSAATTEFPSVSRTSPYASSDCVATLRRFAGQAGFSETVVGQLAPCRRKSTRLNSQVRWGKFRQWCRVFDRRSSEPTIPKVAEFLTFLFRTEKAAVSTIKGYRALLSSVFSSVYRRFRLHIFSRTWCAPLRSQLLARYIIRLCGIWTRFWSTCQALLLILWHKLPFEISPGRHCSPWLWLPPNV